MNACGYVAAVDSDSPLVSTESRPLSKLREGECFYFVVDVENGRVKADAIRWRYIGERASFDGPKCMIRKEGEDSPSSNIAWSAFCLVCPCEY